jgi:hypothetical protein
MQHLMIARVGPKASKDILGHRLRVSRKKKTAMRSRKNVKAGHVKGQRAMAVRPIVVKGDHVKRH